MADQNHAIIAHQASIKKKRPCRVMTVEKVMETSDSANLSWRSKDETIVAIEETRSGQSIIVDFDETLFLRNSTEEYLDSIQPRLLGAMLLFTIKLLKPWKWLPGRLRDDTSEDWLRVLLATIVFPWTLILWKRKAQKLAVLYGNTELLHALKSNQKANLIIASNGFSFIIEPVLAQFSLPIQHIIACRLLAGGKDRQQGKKSLVTHTLGENTLKHAVVVTDSEGDLPLLTSVAKPCLSTWPKTKYKRAMSDFYIPFFYTERVKQPGNSYLNKVILAEDLLFLLLAISWVSPNPLLNGIGITFLMASFWCIYEIGYMENDLVAEKLEKKPSLSRTYHKHKSRINFWQPWLWSILFSLPGVVLLQASTAEFVWEIRGVLPDALLDPNLSQVLIALGKWLAFLIIVRATYFVYNHVNKLTRVWLYPFLQVYKCFGFLIIASTNLVGSMFFVSQSVSRWILYIVYRYSDGSWNKVGQIIRFMVFGLLILALVAGSQDLSLLNKWQTIVFFLYATMKARSEFSTIIREFGLIR